MAFEQFFIDLIVYWGYIGIFLAGFFSTVLPIPFPSPTFVFALLAGKLMDPFFVGLAGGIGAAIGECSGYYMGVVGNHFLIKKHKKEIKMIKEKFVTYRSELIIFFFAATPLPFDLVGVFAGSIKYPFKNFLIANTFGKVVKYWILAYAGFYSITWLIDIFALV